MSWVCLSSNALMPRSCLDMGFANDAWVLGIKVRVRRERRRIEEMMDDFAMLCWDEMVNVKNCVWGFGGMFYSVD